MKPKDVESAFAELVPLLNERQLLISVIAGLSIAKLKSSVANQYADRSHDA